jgi:ABC-type transporter Mla subunit MlaD
MKSTEAKVGAFVVICAAILCATVYSVGNMQFRGAHVAYRTYLRYAGGLEPGTPVLFGGIAVGKVTSVAPDASDPTRIEIDLDVKHGTPVNAKSVAKLGAVSLMGGSVISITTGARDAPRLAPGAVIASTTRSASSWRSPIRHRPCSRRWEPTSTTSRSTSGTCCRT